MKDCLLTSHRYQPKRLLFSGGRWCHTRGLATLSDRLTSMSHPSARYARPKCPNVMRPRCNSSNCRTLDTLWIHCDKNSKNDTKYTNMQIHNYTSTKIQKYTSTQIHKCTNTQIQKNTSTRINKQTNKQISERNETKV